MLRLNPSFSGYHLLVLVATLAVYCGGCALSKDQTKITRSEETKPSLQSVAAKPSTPSSDKQPLETQSPAPSLDKQLDGKGIPKVDFRNFTYPVTEDLRDILPARTFSVVDGGYSFRGGATDVRVEIHHLGTIYDHVTGKDTSPSAIVVFSIFTGIHGMMGTGRSHCVFIYGWPGGKLKLLWSFDTGDRADRGLRDIYGESGNLIIETYRDDVGFAGACCPKTFMRSIYEWTGSRFKQIEAKRLDNPYAGASPILRGLKQN
jgi:hypothetical protein